MDLKSYPREELIKNFGKVGNYFYDVVRGIDDRPVVQFREPKSIGAERTYETDLYDIDLVKQKLAEVHDIMWKRYEAKKKKAKTITRSSTQNQAFSYEEMKTCLMNLLPQQEIKENGVRLLGATMSNFQIENQKSSKQIKIDFDSGNH
jgi:DNA polymerase-4